ncbi:MAG TPA: hypothetical protein VF790_09560 [Dissulfurispiraceae bacterium]
MHKKPLAISLIVIGLFVLAGCAGMVGQYRGPEPFGGKNYNVAPPNANFTRTVRIVLLMFKDERTANEHDLDWTRQAHFARNATGQPMEVRTEFHRALTSGLTAHRRIQLIAPETFLQTKDADLIISGRILKCQAERTMGFADVHFRGVSAIEVAVRNRLGKQLWTNPLVFNGTVERPYKFANPFNARADDINPGFISSVL